MFIDKLKKYFRLRDVPEPIKPEYSSPQSEYYGKVSERFSTAQMILYVVLTVFVLISLIINSEWIKYENFYYFFSDMGNYITDSDSHIEEVVYKEDLHQSFSMYGNKFCVVGNSGLKLYTASGRLIIDDCDETQKLSNPKLSASDRYILMYDMGSGKYSIYNIFSKVFSGDMKAPVYGADVSDSGSFLLITEDSVNLFDNQFKPYVSYNISNVVSASISASGGEIAMISYSVEDKTVVTNVSAYRAYSDTPYIDNLKIMSSLPLYCEYTESNRLLVVCDNRVCAYDTMGRLISDTELSGKSVCADVNQYGAALVLKHNDGTYSLSVFDSNGKNIYDENLKEFAESVALYKSFVFIDHNTTIERLDVRNGELISFENIDYNTVILPKNETELFVCMPTRVKYINFD